MLLRYLFDLVVHNHDAQVRFKWNKNDLAIWVSFVEADYSIGGKTSGRLLMHTSIGPGHYSQQHYPRSFSLTICITQDNRSVFHTATYDYPEVRAGDRVCSLGEAPFLSQRWQHPHRIAPSLWMR
jgi:hypothetical protein